MLNKDKIFNFEIVIFIILLFFQNFAVIATKNFGIAALTVFMIFIIIKYKLFFKINKRFLGFILVFSLFVFLSYGFNQILDFMQVARTFMIIFVGWSTYKYMRLIQEKEKISYFYKVFFKILIIITIYGIYQIIASSANLPMFLNVFNNNPSYSVKAIYENYEGWNNSSRIYATFYEPSAYAIFLIIAYFFIMDSKIITKNQKIVASILTIINIVFTYSRSGWITFVYFICIYLLFKIFKKENIIKKFGRLIIILLPLITILIMSMIGLTFFKDLSSKARTYSSLYYLENSLNNVKSVLIGNGIGSVSKIEDGKIYKNNKIEKFAHNGYIEIVYQFGWIFLIYLIIIILRFLKRSNITNEWIVYATIFTLCCFGSMYNIESIIALVCIVINTLKYKAGVE